MYSFRDDQGIVHDVESIESTRTRCDQVIDAMITVDGPGHVVREVDLCLICFPYSEGESDS